MRFLLALLLLLVLGAFLRLRGHDYLLPLLAEPDPHCPIQVQLIEEDVEEPSAVPDWGKYPHLVAWTTIALTEPYPPVGAEAPLEEHLEAASHPVRRTRWTVALLGLLAIPATWLLARRVTGEGGALLAAALVTTSLLACHFGAQARPHGAAIAFSTLTLWAWARVAARGTWGDYVLGSACGALAVGTLQSGLALGFPVLAAHVAVCRRVRVNPWVTGGGPAPRLLVPPVFLGLSFWLLWPFLFAEGGDGAQLETKGRQVQQAGHRIMLGLFNGEGFAILLEKAAGWEPALLLGVALLLPALMLGRPVRRAAGGGGPLVIWAYAVPYLVVNGLYERVYERFLLPVVPLMAVGAAWAVSRLAARWPRPALVAPLVLVLLAPPALVAFRLTELRARPTTQELAAEWLEEHASPDDRILVTRKLNLPLWRSPVALAGEGPAADERSVHVRVHWNQYQKADPRAERRGETWNLVWFPPVTSLGKMLKRMRERPDEFVRRQFGDWAVVEQFTQGRIDPGIGAVARAFRRASEPGVLARFSPDPEGTGTGHPLAYQDAVGGRRVEAEPMAWRVLRAERMGPVIEILQPPFHE